MYPVCTHMRSLPHRVRIRSSKYFNNVVEQDHRPDKTAPPADALVEALRDGGRDDSGHRVSGENRETTIQPQTPNWKSRHRSRIMGRSPGGLKSEKPLARQKHIT
jgi:hypothetical protein